ncbi:hypothetical protein SAMN05660772_02044 [Pasteurella testudinis DSM 23072]|uniref:Uncharacterized protein n=1 Tax=Pasteurella testudinis DSM 23072 TaxID=1122938 RepID=A0A1W1UME1_9PAST|nr:hypothetical protein SAMN05660772_02044 [Pasteurella testudinis DSM 23072]SUB51482.1 Uncharacterised protein [Pasteurella testudinis]
MRFIDYSILLCIIVGYSLLFKLGTILHINYFYIIVPLSISIIVAIQAKFKNLNHLTDYILITGLIFAFFNMVAKIIFNLALNYYQG